MQKLLAAAVLRTFVSCAHAPVHAEDPNRNEDGTKADEDPQASDVADLGHKERSQETPEPAASQRQAVCDWSSPAKT